MDHAIADSHLAVTISHSMIQNPKWLSGPLKRVQYRCISP